MSTHTALRYIALLSAASLPFFTTGCNRTAAVPQAPPPPAVTVAPAQQEELTEWDEFTGRTEAVESVEVRPRVSGLIQEIRFQSGQLVKKGDVLFIIDPRPYKAVYDQRQAQYAQAKAHLENSQRNADRNTKLLATRAISSEQGDATQSQYEEDKAALLSAASLLESARLDLEFTQVCAPVDGRVSRALMTVGNYVSGVAGGASLLTTLVSVDPIYVYADVDEDSLLKFNALAQKRQEAGAAAEKIPVELALADESTFPHKGYIESFDNKLDPNTGTILLRALVPNPDGRIVPGLFARIRVPTTDKHPVVLVDETAIGTDQAQKFVLTLDDKNIVKYREVKLGPVIDGKRIVRSGLEAGEKIIVNGLQRARPGLPVTPEEEVATVPASAPRSADASH
ncbi:multidrug efflux RND transporter periplasmic adaptor subunit MexE [soil metagenome]